MADLPPEEWTPGYADFASACSAVRAAAGRSVRITQIPVEAGFAGDGLLLAAIGECGVGNPQIIVLAHLVLIDHGADLEADLGHTAQRRALALDRQLDAAEIALGDGQQVRALAPALRRQLPIAADDQPLAGINRERRSRLGRDRRTATIAGGRHRSSSWIFGALSAVIQPSPAGSRSSRIRALVIMPRSPTTTTRSKPKRPLSLRT
jgi:hypothetical protein